MRWLDTALDCRESSTTRSKAVSSHRTPKRRSAVMHRRRFEIGRLNLACLRSSVDNALVLCQLLIAAALARVRKNPRAGERGYPKFRFDRALALKQASFGVRWLDTALDCRESSTTRSKAVSSHRTPKRRSAVMHRRRFEIGRLNLACLRTRP